MKKLEKAIEKVAKRTDVRADRVTVHFFPDVEGGYRYGVEVKLGYQPKRARSLREDIAWGDHKDLTKAANMCIRDTKRLQDEYEARGALYLTPRYDG
jgi:hypothetical protein